MLFYWILASMLTFLIIHIGLVIVGHHDLDENPLIFLVSLLFPLGLFLVIVYISVWLLDYAIKYTRRTLPKLRDKLFGSD